MLVALGFVTAHAEGDDASRCRRYETASTGRAAQVTVRFVSQLISVTRDKAGNVIEGNPEKVIDVTDVWTFARDLASRDPNWKLVATEAGQ